MALLYCSGIKKNPILYYCNVRLGWHERRTTQTKRTQIRPK